MRAKLLGGVGVATIAVAIAAGCSGKSSGASNKVTGSIMGGTFTPQSGSFTAYPLAAGETVDVGFLSTDPDFCDHATANSLQANSKIMLFEFGAATNDTAYTPAQVAGHYTLINLNTGASTIPPLFFGGEYTMFDNTCNLPALTTTYLTTAGTGFMDLTKVSTNAINGKDPQAVFDDGDTVNMSIALKPCPGMLTAFTGTVPPTCLPQTATASAATSTSRPLTRPLHR